MTSELDPSPSLPDVMSATVSSISPTTTIRPPLPTRLITRFNSALRNAQETCGCWGRIPGRSRWIMRRALEIPSIRPFNHRISRALSSFDLTHNFVVSYNYDLPFHRLAPSRGAARKLLEGWRING